MASTVTERNGAYIVNVPQKGIVRIPSSLYPVPGPVQCIGPRNTEEFPAGEQTDIIREVFNSVELEMGRCYSNIQKLVTKLAAAGIESMPMVGWMFYDNVLPVHHCMAMIGNHVLDYTICKELLLDGYPRGVSRDDGRKWMVERMRKLRRLPNSETCSFGKVDSQAMMLAAPGDPLEGLNTSRKLKETYPNHPCYQNVDGFGRNALYRMYHFGEKG